MSRRENKLCGGDDLLLALPLSTFFFFPFSAGGVGERAGWSTGSHLVVTSSSSTNVGSIGCCCCCCN